MNRIEYLLACLAEEGCEIGQRATKAQRFGITETQPNHDSDNTERLVGEINDLLGVVELLHDHGIDMASVGDRAAISTKKAKVLHFMRYSEELGTLDVTP